MTRSEDRWTYPTEGEDPRDYDDPERVAADGAKRQVSHDQHVERSQGLSSDKPGIDVSSEREAEERVPTGQTYAEDPRPKQAEDLPDPAPGQT